MTSSGLPKLWRTLSKILSFKVIFQCLKLFESLQEKSVKNIWPTYINVIFWKLKMCPIFVVSVHNFGKYDDEIV